MILNLMKAKDKLLNVLSVMVLLLGISLLSPSGVAMAQEMEPSPSPSSSPLSLDATAFEAGEECRLSLALEEGTPYYGLQADVQLPEGVSFGASANGKPAVALSAALTEAGFTLVSNLLDDGVLRLALFSISHAAIPAGAEPILTITINTSGSFKTGVVRFSDIMLTDDGHHDIMPGDLSLNITAAPARGDGLLSVAPAAIEPGNAATLPLLLTSDREYYGLQTEITLPAGISFAANDGTSPVTLSEEMRARGFTTVSNLTDEGTLRLAVFSLSHGVIPAGEEPLLTVAVKADAAFAGGDVTLSGTLVTNADGLDESLDDSSTPLEVYLPSNSFYPEALEIARGESATLLFVLDNETPFTALQTDITFPEYLSADAGSVRLSERAGANHTVSCSSPAANVLRVVCFSADSEPFSGDSGVLFSVEVTAEEELADVSEIRTSSTVCSTARAREYHLADASAEVTAFTREVPLEGIAFYEREIELEVGDSFALEYELTPADAPVLSLAWSSDKPEVATVDADGTVKAVTPGHARITLTAEGEAGSLVSDYCDVTVKDFEVGIGALVDSKSDDAIYDVLGRRVSSAELPAGVYVIGGRKVLVR